LAHSNLHLEFVLGLLPIDLILHQQLPKFALRKFHNEVAVFLTPTSYKHSVHEELLRFTKEFYTTGTQGLMQSWKKRVDYEGYFVEK
jgi:hypothetical protein